MSIETNRIIEGDCMDVLGELPAESVHAVVTDPPYALSGSSGFMGREWDSFDSSHEYQAWAQRWATKALRVLKPGGHLLAFGGNTRHHRLFAGVEDAGYEIRDTLTYLYGSGFPKALDVSEAGGEGAELKTALKPATEFVCLARKPFDSTVAENVMRHGTGALNIGVTRIETDDSLGRDTGNGYGGGCYANSKRAGSATEKDGGSGFASPEQQGRYPANLVLDGQAARMLDAQSGEAGDLVGYKNENNPDDDDLYGNSRPAGRIGYSDSGGASRFYYTSKASRSERTLDGTIDNAHPTVKPLDLMEWLVKLATADGQTVLDPFAGTGTTCLAAKNAGREFVGIERQANWCDVARARCGLDVQDPSVLTDDGQGHLGAYADGGDSA